MYRSIDGYETERDDVLFFLRFNHPDDNPAYGHHVPDLVYGVGNDEDLIRAAPAIQSGIAERRDNAEIMTDVEIEKV